MLNVDGWRWGRWWAYIVRLTCCRDSAGSNLEKSDFFFKSASTPCPTSHRFSGPKARKSGARWGRVCERSERVTKFDKIEHIFLPKFYKIDHIFLQNFIKVTKFYKFAKKKNFFVKNLSYNIL